MIEKIIKNQLVAFNLSLLLSPHRTPAVSLDYKQEIQLYL